MWRAISSTPEAASGPCKILCVYLSPVALDLLPIQVLYDFRFLLGINRCPLTVASLLPAIIAPLINISLAVRKHIVHRTILRIALRGLRPVHVSL